MTRTRAHQPLRYEAEIAAGLEPVAYQELRQHLGAGLQLLSPLASQVHSGVLRFQYSGDVRRLLQLQTVLNLYWLGSYAIPRPKTLLAQEHFTRLVGEVQQVLALTTAGRYYTFTINAAGANSPVFQQLRERLAAALQLADAPDDADLLLRIRPARLNPTGWEVLIRLTPRPLSVRPWRVADMKGALNAAVAHALVLLTQPQPQDKFLNLACGSGTLLIERLMAAPARRVIGCDSSAEALACARANLAAGHWQDAVELYEWDARTLNLPDASMDALCADLPFGIAVGDHVENITLYPELLREAARVAKAKARFVLMTQEVTLMEDLLSECPEWKLLEEIKLTLRGLHPRLYVLQRRGGVA
ncbi:MAG: methyltransferase domain-containing protein [Caldilineaceae bacterium]